MLKRSDKLPRGSYFYIAVGERFYGGRDPVKETVSQKDFLFDSAHNPWEGASYPKPRKAKRMFGDSWPGGNERWRLNEARDAHSGRTRRATILNAKRLYKPLQGTIEVLTGKSVPRLVDDIKDVKQFRRRAQAETVCEELNRMYGEFNVKVTIKLHEGE